MQPGVGGGLCEVLAQPVMRPAGKSLRSFHLRIPQSWSSPRHQALATYLPTIYQAVAHLTPSTIPKTKFSSTFFIQQTDKEHPVGARIHA